MLCPKCGLEIADELAICPECGYDLPPAVAETPAEVAEEAAEVITGEAPEGVSEAAAEEAAEAAPEEAAEEPAAEPAEEAEAPKKKSPLSVILVVVVILLALLVACLGIALSKVSKGEELPSISDILPDNFKGDATAVAITDSAGNELFTMSNTEFGFYYWGEYYYFINYNGLQFDALTPLDEQMFDETQTWHDYFVDMSCQSITQIAALKSEAEAAGFQMPADYQAEYDAVVETMPSNAANTGFVDENGEGDILAYIQDSYGATATVEEFEEYLYDSYYASAYSEHLMNSFVYDDETLSAYFDENAEFFASYGIEKTDRTNINARHILISPETAPDGSVAEDAQEAAKEEAERILKEWQDGDATEESFAELAVTYSADSGTSVNGGLLTDVYPGQTVTEFNDWCFDENRESGDVEIVETTFGYHIIYFVSDTENYYWKTVADSEKRYNDYSTAIENLTSAYFTVPGEKLDVRDPDAVKLIQDNVRAEQEAAATATESSAAE